MLRWPCKVSLGVTIVPVLVSYQGMHSQEHNALHDLPAGPWCHRQQLALECQGANPNAGGRRSRAAGCPLSACSCFATPITCSGDVTAVMVYSQELSITDCSWQRGVEGRAPEQEAGAHGHWAAR